MDASKSRQAGSRARPPAGFLGLVLILVAVEAVLAAIGDRQDSLVASDWRYTWKIARSENARSAEVLCFGDSAIKTGISPEILADVTGRSAFNLATTAGPTSSSYFLLRRALDAGARPKAIVVDAMEHLLGTSAPRAIIEELAKVLRPSEAFALARVEHDPGLMGLYFVHLLPSIRYRNELRAAVRDFVTREPVTQRFVWKDPIHRQLNKNRGAMFLPASHAKEAADPHADGVLGPFEAALAYSQELPRSANLSFLREFLRLAEAQSIPVYLVLPPYPPSVQEQRNRLGLSEGYSTLMRDISARHGNVVVVDARDVGLPHWNFADALHPSAEGAATLTRAVARVLQGDDSTASPAIRWVALPRWTEEAEKIPENLTESVMFVLSLTAKRR